MAFECICFMLSNDYIIILWALNERWEIVWRNQYCLWLPCPNWSKTEYFTFNILQLRHTTSFGIHLKPLWCKNINFKILWTIIEKYVEHRTCKYSINNKLKWVKIVSSMLFKNLNCFQTLYWKLQLSLFYVRGFLSFFSFFHFTLCLPSFDSIFLSRIKLLNVE